MKKIVSWISDNVLFVETIFLLAFIPLYPKLPLLDIKNTWVYIRAEDFVVLFVLLSMLILLFKRRISLRTPLTIPILVFWIIGAIATIHGVLLIFPKIANVFPNVAFLSLMRHIEYMSLFFIAYLGMKDPRRLTIVIGTLVTTLSGVVLYGFGQKYLGFPAYLTMNEEFAKGAPITLSGLSRVPSTFAGHYDLAAYLVLIIPILISLIFGFKSWLIRAALATVSLLGIVLLFMTVSRVSFFVLFVSLLVVIFFQKKKVILFSIPAAILLGFLFITFQPTLLDRFKGTVSEVDVLVDANTGESVGHVRFVSQDYFKDKIVLRRIVRDKADLAYAIMGKETSVKDPTESAIYPSSLIPDNSPLVTAVNVSNGENLPQGTGYINLPLSPVVQRLPSFFYELPPNVNVESTISAQILVIQGDFIVKKASAYDLSFTTRFQGEWPRAIEAFERNILVGSGYGSVSLAVDNNYLRILGEIGILGFTSFLVIFLSLGIYIKRFYRDLESSVSKSFVLGFSAGLIGLSLNALLIDVFEASKIAFLLWTLVGITLAILVSGAKKELNLFSELKKAATSTYAVFVYLFLLSIVLFSPIMENYFVGDDFTWLRWAADCRDKCSSFSSVIKYFTESDGFFYRPGTKIFFDFMYSTFWLNQNVYHLVSILLHFAVASLFYLLALRVLRRKILAASSAFLFLVMAGPAEAVFWISSVGHLFNALLGLLGLMLFILWEEKRKAYYYIGAFVSFALALLFHELGIVFPLLVLAYKMRDGFVSGIRQMLARLDFLTLFIPGIAYLFLRYASHSHWFSGDYSYDILKLPFNFFGNILGYLSLIILGPISLPFYETLRSLARGHMILGIVAISFSAILLYLVYRFVYKKLSSDDKRVVLFGIAFFTIALLPFLGLGNITSRYSYLASVGPILILVMLARKSYEYLKASGREIAIGASTLIFLVFALFHIIQVQQAYFDWHEAGKYSKNFFVSIDALYDDEWSKDVRFHFVNVPIRHGQAWIFPVGLSDAVWFAFKNDDTRVFIHNSLEELDLPSYTINDIVLRFNPDGSVEQIHFIKPLVEN